MRALFLLDDQAAELTIKEKILYGLIASFLACAYLPHTSVISNILFGLIALFSFFYNSFREKAYLLMRRKEVIVIILFYLLHIISAILSKNKQEAFRDLVLRLPLLAWPVVLGWMFIRQAMKERILYAYGLVSVFVMLFCIIWGLYQYKINNEPALLYNDSLTLIIDRQSVYVAMMVNLGIFCFVYLLHKGSHLVSNRAFVYAGMALLLLANFLLASRSAIIILYTGILGYGIYEIIKAKKYLAGISLLLGLLIGGFVLVKLFPKTVNRFKELTYTKFDFQSKGVESHYNMEVTADQWNGANIRLAVWKCGWDLVKEHPVFGVQLGDKMDKMMEQYALHKFDFAYNSRRNLHSNYLDVLVTFGITGLLLFLSGFIVIPLVKCIRTGDVFGSIIILVFAIALASETYMDRNWGNMLLSFFTGFIISYRKPAAQNG